MILNANGSLRVKITTGEGLDDKGYPIQSVVTWGDPIRCNIKTNSKASTGITTNNNVFETSSYEVLIDKQVFDAGIVSLERDGVHLGECQVQGELEHLNFVQNIKFNCKFLL